MTNTEKTVIISIIVPKQGVFCHSQIKPSLKGENTMTDPNTKDKPKRVAVYIDYSFIRQVGDQIGRLNLLLLSQFLRFDDLLVRQLTFIPIIQKNNGFNDMENFIRALLNQDMDVYQEQFIPKGPWEAPIINPEAVMNVVMEDFGNLDLEIVVLVTDKITWIPIVDALEKRGVYVEIAGILSVLPKALTYNVSEVYDLADPDVLEKIKFENRNTSSGYTTENKQILAHV